MGSSPGISERADWLPSGALLATLATSAFLYVSTHPLNLALLAAALFLRGAGLGGIGIPAMAAAYGTVPRSDLPMATTTLNIVQRLGGPALTTLCATFLSWQLEAAHAGPSNPAPYAWSFALLSGLHAALLLVALGFPDRYRA